MFNCKLALVSKQMFNCVLYSFTTTEYIISK